MVSTGTVPGVVPNLVVLTRFGRTLALFRSPYYSTCNDNLDAVAMLAHGGHAGVNQALLIAVGTSARAQSSGAHKC